MILKEYLKNKTDTRILIKESEILELVQHKTSSCVFSTIVNNVTKGQIDEEAFEFLYRRINVFINRITNLPHIKFTEEASKLELLIKIISCINFSFDKFQYYISDDDIVRLFESLNYCDEKMQELLQRLLFSIINKFGDASKLYKEIISNKFTRSNTALMFDVFDFEFKIILLMANRQSFGCDCIEFYSQFLLPQMINCNLENIGIVKSVIEVFCSASPQCQRLTLKYFLKIYPKVDTEAQIKILDYTTCIIHSNTFFKAKSFLEWEFCEIFNLGITSESYIIINSAILMLENAAVKTFVQRNIKVVLPKIFANMYRLCKRFWKQEQRLKALEIISEIFKMDKEVFETSLIEYNKERHLQFKSKMKNDKRGKENNENISNVSVSSMDKIKINKNK